MNDFSLNREIRSNLYYYTQVRLVIQNYFNLKNMNNI